MKRQEYGSNTVIPSKPDPRVVINKYRCAKSLLVETKMRGTRIDLW